MQNGYEQLSIKIIGYGADTCTLLLTPPHTRTTYIYIMSIILLYNNVQHHACAKDLQKFDQGGTKVQK